jgi:hypothetical protein
VKPCIRWGIVGVGIGLSAVAFAQSPPDPADPTTAILLHLLSTGGLPAVLGVAAWWLRGAIGAGIPVVVSISESDRRLIQALIEKQDRS